MPDFIQCSGKVELVCQKFTRSWKLCKTPTSAKVQKGELTTRSCKGKDDVEGCCRCQKPMLEQQENQFSVFCSFPTHPFCSWTWGGWYSLSHFYWTDHQFLKKTCLGRRQCGTIGQHWSSSHIRLHLGWDEQVGLRTFTIFIIVVSSFCHQEPTQTWKNPCKVGSATCFGRCSNLRASPSGSLRLTFFKAIQKNPNLSFNAFDDLKCFENNLPQNQVLGCVPYVQVDASSSIGFRFSTLQCWPRRRPWGWPWWWSRRRSWWWSWRWA